MKNAFTLTELLVIIGIIGILALITIPAFRLFQPSLLLSSVTRELVTDLKYVQQLTVTEQVEYCLQFFSIEKKYQMVQCGESNPFKEKILPEEITTLTVAGFTNDEVRYNPYGAVKEAGTIILENTKNDTKTILVKPSGFVEISD